MFFDLKRLNVTMDQLQVNQVEFGCNIDKSFFKKKNSMNFLREEPIQEISNLEIGKFRMASHTLFRRIRLGLI